MKKHSIHRSVRLDPALDTRVEALAVSQGRSVADIVRIALEQYLLGQKLITDSDIRLRRICEYNQLALDTIIVEEHPQVRDTILARTADRMERYHGTR